MGSSYDFSTGKTPRAPRRTFCALLGEQQGARLRQSINKTVNQLEEKLRSPKGKASICFAGAPQNK
jgi:hypothetical protein